MKELAWKPMRKTLAGYEDGREYVLLFAALPGAETRRALESSPVVATFRRREGKAASYCWDLGRGPVFFHSSQFCAYFEVPAYDAQGGLSQDAA